MQYINIYVRFATYCLPIVSSDIDTSYMEVQLVVI